MKTEKNYSEKELVSFANYVLSKSRNSLIQKVHSKTVVYDADLENWKNNESNIRN